MKALLTGSAGMLGSHVVEAWSRSRPHDTLIALTRSDADLRERHDVESLVARHAPDVVIHVAAHVGGIGDRTKHPAEYLLSNVLIDSAVIGACITSGVKDLLYVSSAAIYPADTPQPIPEEALMTGPLEPALEPYGLAKIVATRMCAFASRELGVGFRAVVPANLYGPGDHFDLGRAHLLPAALRKMHDAKLTAEREVVVWGDGTARREFVFGADLATWMVDSLDSLGDWPEVLNVGYGEDFTVREYYEMAREVVDADVTLVFDASKPVGVAQRLLDSSKASDTGWTAPTDPRLGLRLTYEAFLSRETGEHR